MNYRSNGMPTLILDQEKVIKNIEKMAQKAAGHGLSFRPHFKTHQSAEIGSWFRDFGVSKITVSSFRMASYFVSAGWNDVLVAFPFNPLEVSQLNELSNSARISILIDNPNALPFLNQLSHSVDYYIDIDTGYGRTGIPSADREAIRQLIQEAQSNQHLSFRGFYCHAGHSYKKVSREEKDPIHQKAMEDLNSLKDSFSKLNPSVLYGDTPNCRIQEDFASVDEITPGNFVFYDLTQFHLGSCALEEIAVVMACPVTGKYADKRLLIHGGAVHFSKETLVAGDRVVFGQVIDTESYITSISQEHGILEQCGKLWDQTRVGDILYIYPVHSCLTANLMSTYQTLDGKAIETM
jgi:D-serine deaminase-like pyridoxal phosphate-dependent protein